MIQLLLKLHITNNVLVGTDEKSKTLKPSQFIFDSSSINVRFKSGMVHLFFSKKLKSMKILILNKTLYVLYRNKKH
jgi:hypothetical protein